jgi:hypothetical protein
MRIFPTFSIAIKGLSIAPPPITHFRWGWDSNPWVPLMLHYLFQSHKQNLPIFSLKLTKPPYSLRRFNTYTNRSMRFCRNPMLSISNTMINTGYSTSFRWETKSGYICRKNALQGLIGSSIHFTIWALHYHQCCGRQWFWAQNSSLPWISPSVQCGASLAIFSTLTRHLRNSRIVDTNRAQTWLHGTCIH